MNALAPTPLLVHIGWSLLDFLWQGALLGLIYACLRKLLRQAAPQWRYGLALSALLVLALLPLLTFFYLGGWQASSLPPASMSTVHALAAAAYATQASLSAMPVNRPPPYLSWVVLVWIAGVAGMLLRALRAWLRAERLRGTVTAGRIHPWQPLLDALQARMHVGRMIRLLESARVHAPLVIGWLKPVILIPPSTLCGLSWQQAEMILAHELAHIRRHDYLFNLLQVAVESVLFYHPVVHWISRDVRNEREFCCDDAAMKICGDRVAYLKALVALEQHRLHAVPAVAATGGALWNRAYRLAYRIEPAGRRSVWASVLLLPAGALALLLMLRPWNALTLTARATASPAYIKTTVPGAGHATLRRWETAQVQAAPPALPTPMRIKLADPRLRLVHALIIPEFTEPAALSAPPPPAAVVPAAAAAAAATTLTVVAPRPLAQPEYPYQALHNELGGAVQVAFRINAHGRVTDIRMQMLSGPAILASAVRDAVENWQFNPVRADGQTLTPQLSFALIFNPDPKSRPPGACRIVTGSHVCHWFRISLQDVSLATTRNVGGALQSIVHSPATLAVVGNERGLACHPQDACFFAASPPAFNHEQRIEDQLRMLSQGLVGFGSQ